MSISSAATYPVVTCDTYHVWMNAAPLEFGLL